MQNHSYENEFPPGSFSCKSNLFSLEGVCTKTRFETEAEGNWWPIFLGGVRQGENIQNTTKIIIPASVNPDLPQLQHKVAYYSH